MSLLFLYLLFELASVVHGAAYVDKDCPEIRCDPSGPVIQFPFRLGDRQPSRCGYPGFDLACSEDNQTMLEMPSSSTKLFVNRINYTSQELETQIHDPDGCLQRQLLNISLSSQFVSTHRTENYTVFSCPSLISKNRSSNSRMLNDCLVRLNPCVGDRKNNHSVIYALSRDCYIDWIPLVSCTKMHDYISVPMLDTTGKNKTLKMNLHWSIPSCEYCRKIKKTCRRRIYYNSRKQNEIQCDLPKGRSGLNFMVIGICTLSVVIIATGIIVIYVYNSSKEEQENKVRVERFLDDYRALKPSRYAYADIKRMTEKFKEKLGQGAYGTVYKGKLSTELFVAVKILNNSNENGEAFINEVATMGRIHHVNVVRLVGFCADGFIRALVYDFLPNGSLQSYLTSPDDNNSFLGWEKLQEIALGIAKGIEYLHQGCDQRILHFDIKPHNVLLDHHFTPKVSDFGLAKLCSKDQSAISMTKARGTMGYIAPEVFSRNFGTVSYKSDVYSFGTLLLEMVGGRKNFKVMENSSSEVYFPVWIYNLLEQGDDLRIHLEDTGNIEVARKLAIVGLWCIQWDPVNRPSMVAVVQMLETEGGNLTIPPNPFASTSN